MHANKATRPRKVNVEEHLVFTVALSKVAGIQDDQTKIRIWLSSQPVVLSSLVVAAMALFVLWLLM